MKKPVKILVIVLAALVALSLLKNVIVQSALSGAMSKAAHVPVSMGRVSVSILSSSIRVKDLRMSNPPGFPEKAMLDAPMIFIDFELSELLTGRAHFKEVSLDLKELTVIKNKEGKLNVDAVKPTEQEKKKLQEGTKPKDGGKAPKLFIDKLKISIGRVVYKDFSGGGAPAIQTFDINIRDREYDNIDNPTTIVSLVMFEALAKTTLSRLANLDLSAFKEGGIKALSGGLGMVSESTDAVEKTAKKITNLFK